MIRVYEKDRLDIEMQVGDKNSLQSIYMPWVQRGGLFIPTRVSYRLHDPLRLTLHLPEAAEAVTVEGRVIWITPPGATGKKPQGVGIQFADSESAIGLNKHLQSFLAGLPQSSRTHTV